MNSKQRRTLKAIFAKPTRSDLAWVDVEALIMALGAQRSEGAGSRGRFLLNGTRITLHRPHPQHEASKAQIDSVRDFLIAAEVKA
jgi:hypothetical protein